MTQRGVTPEEDDARGWTRSGTITEVTPYSEGGGWSVAFDEGWICGVRDVGREPQVGDTLTVYGQFGYQFHGQALNGTVLWYLSPAEEAAERERAQAEQDDRRRAQFEAQRAELDADYDALPPTFRERIDKFRATNPDFRWQFEAYEMMCCRDAVQIATYCSTHPLAMEYEGDEPTAAENLRAFQRLSPEEQRAAGLDEGHSGNSFGFALRLAYLWVTDPGAVVAEHGALTPLVGCEEYGCPHPVAA